MHKLGLESETRGRQAEIEDRKAAPDEERLNRETDARISANDRMVQAKASAASAVQRMNAVQQATGFSQTSPADIAGEEEPDAGSFMSL